MNRKTFLILAALAIFFATAVAWKVIEIASCRSDGGIVVFAMMLEQQCVTPGGG